MRRLSWPWFFARRQTSTLDSFRKPRTNAPKQIRGICNFPLMKTGSLFMFYCACWGSTLLKRLSPG
jgi:hypothetical protein